jgi:hypothetical protein
LASILGPRTAQAKAFAPFLAYSGFNLRYAMLNLVIYTLRVQG